MNAVLDQWPGWMSRLFWTVATIALSYVIGHAVRMFLATRLLRIATKTRRDWDDVLAAEIKRRIPFWSLLIGFWLALDDWPLESRWVTLLSRLISTMGVASVTLLAASVATRFVANYGPRVSPAVPVSQPQPADARRASDGRRGRRLRQRSGDGRTDRVGGGG